MPAAVHEERRRARDAAQIRAVDVLRDVSRAGVGSQALGEPVDVEAELARIADEIARLERVLPLEQQVVVLPERVLALRSRGLGRLRRELRARVDVVQRQVPPHVANLAGAGEQLANHLLRTPAERALEVAVLEERDRCVLRPADVVTRAVDRRGQVDEDVGSSDERPDADQLRQQRGAPEQQPGGTRRDQRGAQHADLCVVQLASRGTQDLRSAATP